MASFSVPAAISVQNGKCLHYYQVNGEIEESQQTTSEQKNFKAAFSGYSRERKPRN